MQKTAVCTTRQAWDRAADMYQAGLFQSYDWGILMEELPGTSFHPVRLTTGGGQVIYLPLFEQKGVLSGNMIGYGGVISDRPISFEWLQSEIQAIFGRNISRMLAAVRSDFFYRRNRGRVDGKGDTDPYASGHV